MTLYERAFQIASAAHAGQTDKAGAPYINHPVAVASTVSTEKGKAVALLHDVLEDTSLTAEDLLEAGIPADVVSAVVVLTKDPDQDYFSYIEQLASCPLARTVKIADLEHNMDLLRLPEVTEEDKKREEKYQKAYSILATYQKKKQPGN